MGAFLIKIFQGADIAAHAREAAAMFEARAAVFGKRLNWNVVVKDGWERDEFDDANPLYLVQINDADEIGGSLRLLPTSGPNMLSSRFAEQFDEPIDISSPLIWECTRFCVHPVGETERDGNDSLKIAKELNLGVCELAVLAGIEQIQAVYDDAMVRLYRKLKWNPEPMAKSTSSPGGRSIYVGLWEVSETILETLRADAGIARSIIEPASAKLIRERVA